MGEMRQVRETMYMVVQNKLPKRFGGWWLNGEAYGIFRTKTEAEEYQLREGLRAKTHIEEV